MSKYEISYLKMGKVGKRFGAKALHKREMTDLSDDTAAAGDGRDAPSVRSHKDHLHYVYYNQMYLHIKCVS